MLKNVLAQFAFKLNLLAVLSNLLFLMKLQIFQFFYKIIKGKMQKFQKIYSVSEVYFSLGVPEWANTERKKNIHQVYSRGAENLSGKSFSNFSLAISATGPNNTTGRMNPGCFKMTLS